MKKIFIGLIGCMMLLLCSGCGEHIIVNGVSYRALSEDEYNAMIAFARMTLINGEKLTAGQQNFIRTQKPSIRISYTGNKAGRASYEWIITDDIMVRLNCEGEFLSDNMKVNTRKIKLQEDMKKNQKSSLEKLTFKEINVDK